MSDQRDAKDQVVRDLEAERHRPSIWWHRAAIGPSHDIATELDRLRTLAESTEPTISTSQTDELLTSIDEGRPRVIPKHTHRAPTGRYAPKQELSTSDPTGPVDDGLYAADQSKDDESNQSEPRTA